MTRNAAASVAHLLDELGTRQDDVEIVTGEACAARYRDPFQLVPPRGPAPAAVRPNSVAAVQEIVRAANRCGATLWPISRGENLGYGGAAAIDAATVILDLSRMNRVLEVNVPDAFCLVEPGVSFLDLFERLERDGAPLWLSVPGYGLGSIVGNALERGVGNTPYGDHAAQICGLEVVLGDGQLVRTGMGAMAGSGMWQRQRSPVGPRYDEIFLQSGLGVVTKMGLWLMPEPEASAAVEVDIAERDGLAAFIDALGQLKRQGVIQAPPVVASYLTAAALRSRRADWAPQGGALGAAEARLLQELGLGWWNAKIRLYGPPETVEAGLERIEQRLRALAGCRWQVSRWRRGEPRAHAHRGVPSADGLANAHWCGERGAHLDFAVGLPSAGAEALRHAIFVYDALAEIGLDYHGAFYLRDRHILNVVQILFDQEDAKMCEAVDALYRRLIRETARRGLGLHRAPNRYRSEVLATFDFGDHALTDLNRRLKAALDPNAVLAPGKDGVI